MGSVKANVRKAIEARGALGRRVTELEREVKECRQANLRLAELTDLMTELLVALAASDDAAKDEVVARYQRSIGMELPGQGNP